MGLNGNATEVMHRHKNKALVKITLAAHAEHQKCEMLAPLLSCPSSPSSGCVCLVSQRQRANQGGHVAELDCCAAGLLQVLLPQSVGHQLEQQGASVNGAPFFQLRVPSGAVTHAGALVYEAAEGTVALPLKVIRRCDAAALL